MKKFLFKTRLVLIIIIVILSIYLPIHLVNHLVKRRQVNKYHRDNIETHNRYSRFSLKETSYLNICIGEILVQDEANIRSSALGSKTYTELSVRDRKFLDEMAPGMAYLKNEKMIDQINNYIKHLKTEDAYEKNKENKVIYRALFYTLLICLIIYKVNTVIGKRL